MRLFLGILIGLLLAVGIAAAAAYMAFGELTDIGERDRSKDITRTYDLQGFDQISVGGVYELDVRVGGDFSITVSGAPDEMDRMEIEVVDGVLQLGQEEPKFGKRRWRNMGLTADISLPSLTAIDVAGVAEVDVEGVDAETFSASLAGVGELDLVGTCRSLTARVSGVGELDASELQCADVDVRVSGVGEARVYAGQSVYASVSGVGSIDVEGSPSEVVEDKSFFADISVR